jgi:hypothetical protein
VKHDEICCRLVHRWSLSQASPSALIQAPNSGRREQTTNTNTKLALREKQGVECACLTFRVRLSVSHFRIVVKSTNSKPLVTPAASHVSERTLHPLFNARKVDRMMPVFQFSCSPKEAGLTSVFPAARDLSGRGGRGICQDVPPRWHIVCAAIVPLDEWRRPFSVSFGPPRGAGQSTIMQRNLKNFRPVRPIAEKIRFD